MGMPESQIKEIVSQTLKDLPTHECPICQGGEWVIPRLPDGKLDYSHPRRCDCVKQKDYIHQQEKYLKLCELPVETENLTFENFQVYGGVKEAYDKALLVADGKLKWLTLSSEVDHGKTHLAIAICRRWLAQGRTAKYAFVPLLLDELKAGFQSGGENSYQNRFDFFCKVNLLVLDDLGVEKKTDWSLEKLETLVDYRYINKLPLVVTTNKNLDDYSPRIGSRLKRFEDGKIVVIKSPQYRLVKKGSK
jgi:DNA replication protein DnaC